MGHDSFRDSRKRSGIFNCKLGVMHNCTNVVDVRFLSKQLDFPKHFGMYFRTGPFNSSYFIIMSRLEHFFMPISK